MDNAPFIIHLAIWVSVGVFFVSFIAGFGTLTFMMRKTGNFRNWNDLWAANDVGWLRKVILGSYAGLLVSFVSLMLLTMMFSHRIN